MATGGVVLMLASGAAAVSHCRKDCKRTDRDLPRTRAEGQGLHRDEGGEEGLPEGARERNATACHDLVKRCKQENPSTAAASA